MRWILLKSATTRLRQIRKFINEYVRQLVVSTAPEVMHDTRRFVPTLVGFAVLGASFYKTRSIIIPTLLSALAYGLAWKVMAII